MVLNSVLQTASPAFRKCYIYKNDKKNADDIKDLISIIIDITNRKTETLSGSKPKQKAESVAGELIKLNELKEKGILTEAEFIHQKNRIRNNKSLDEQYKLFNCE